MAGLNRLRSSRRLWWIAGGVAVVLLGVSFGTPKAGCAGSPDDQPDDVETRAIATELATLEHAPEASGSGALVAIEESRFCPTAGRVAGLGKQAFKVNVGGMRGVIAGDTSRSAELAFVFRGPSKETAPLADGSLRQQIGLKLRAFNTCNVVYVMWHILPEQGLWVMVKSNPGQTEHAQCHDNGYTTVMPTKSAPLPELRVDEGHTLRADLDGDALRVFADGAPVWEGKLPRVALSVDGPVGTRSDNGEFDFELRIPPGGSARSCDVVE